MYKAGIGREETVDAIVRGGVEGVKNTARGLSRMEGVVAVRTIIQSFVEGVGCVHKQDGWLKKEQTT